MDRLLDEEHRTVPGQAGHQVLGALVDEGPAQMTEDDER